jgi:cAMP-binding proteins - catabolite gene activator and regulatory subunit of cAMP-dependent protein kinases
MGSIFNNLSERELDFVHELISDVHAKPGEVIFNEGDSADFLYYIVSGTVSIYIEKFNSIHEIQVAKVGDWFGEVAVVNKSYRTASAKTLETTHLRKVSSDDFHALLAREPSIRRTILAIVSERNEKLVLRRKNAELSDGTRVRHAFQHQGRRLAARIGNGATALRERGGQESDAADALVLKICC